MEPQSEDSMFGREFDQLLRGSAGSELDNLPSSLSLAFLMLFMQLECLCSDVV